MSEVDSEQFNFIGESHQSGFDYKILLSINANELVHLAKASCNSTNQDIQTKLKKFCDFAEGRLLNRLDEFFEENELDPLYYALQRGLLEFTGERAILKNKIKYQKVLCSCSGLTLPDLQKILAAATFTLETLVKETRAGTGCSSCKADLKIIVKSFDDYPKLTAASYLRLWNSLGVSQAEFLCRCKKVTALEIAEILEKKNHTSSDQIYLKLQSSYGVGLSCNDCVQSIQEILR